MALNTTHRFLCPPGMPPRVSAQISSRTTARQTVIEAFVDTGADGTLLDLEVAEALGLDLQNATRVRIGGVGGELAEARAAEVEIELLVRAELRATLQVMFVANAARTHGNLLGLNALAIFDFAVQHSVRLGHLGLAGGL